VSLRGRAAVAGVGMTPFRRRSGQSELVLGLEAIRLAAEDAGVTLAEIDGLVSSMAQQNEVVELARALGVRDLSFFSAVDYGGGACCALVGHAAAAVATGLARCVVAWRARCRSPEARPWAATGARVGGEHQFSAPYGLVRPVDQVAMVTRRHMHRYGTTSAHLAAVAIACRSHATRNPAALMRAPLTVAEHQASRVVSDPLRLLDCCLENDAGAAFVVVPAERAADLRQRAVYVRATAQGTGFLPGRMTDYVRPEPLESSAVAAARTLFRAGDCAPTDVDTIQVYDSFTPFVLFALEAYGFCRAGESGPFAAEGHIQWPDGRLPANTSGGGLSEGYIQGMNLVAEAVRQLRGTSTCQVPEAALALVAGATTVPTSALLLGRDP